MKKIELPPENEKIYFPDHGCFGCSQKVNEAGLKLSFERVGEKIICNYSIPGKFCGYPGSAHGGIIATIFDEVSCAAVILLKSRLVVTGELNIQYKNACPTESPVVFSAYITDESHPKYAVVEGTLHNDEKLLSTSKSKIFYVNDEVQKFWELG